MGSDYFPVTLHDAHSCVWFNGLTCMIPPHLPVGPKLGGGPELFNIEANSKLWTNKTEKLAKRFSSFVTGHIMNLPSRLEVFPSMIREDPI